jgi:hypothetical protein
MEGDILAARERERLGKTAQTETNFPTAMAKELV